MALGAGPSASGRGGMRTKLEAAAIAMNCGGTAVIANGNVADALDRIFAGERIGTAFLAREADARKAALDCVCRGRPRASGGGCRRAPRHYAGEGEPARFGHRARGEPLRVHGRGEHRGCRRSRIRARASPTAPVARRKSFRERRAIAVRGMQLPRPFLSRATISCYCRNHEPADHRAFADVRVLRRVHRPEGEDSFARDCKTFGRGSQRGADRCRAGHRAERSQNTRCQ